MANVVRTISTRVAIDGEPRYRQAITSINVELTKFQSALKMVSSQYVDNANSLEALRVKQAALNSVIDTQNVKLNEQNAGLANAQKAEAAWAAQKDELTAKIRANERELENLSQSGRTYGGVAESLTKGTEALKEKLEESEAVISRRRKEYQNGRRT
jgi:chromosome segregation ATPase